MEKHEFILHMSLRQTALIKIAISVWNEAENLNLLKQINCENVIFPKIVKKKVSLLVLPEEVKEELLNTLDSIALEMLRWKKRLEAFLPNTEYFLDQLCWTSVGTVDHRKTAETLIKQERIDISSSYRLACLYCLVKDIPIIWKKLPDDSKIFFSKRSTMIDFRNIQFNPIAIWTHLINGADDYLRHMINASLDVLPCRNCSVARYAFTIAAVTANKEATEFFLRKLTPEERKVSLVPTAKRVVSSWGSQSYFENVYKLPEKFCDVVIFLLTQMDKEEQMEIFKMEVWKTLVCFLDWPWYPLFMKVARISFEYFRDSDIEMMISFLLWKQKIAGYYYPNLFQELYLEAPNYVRAYFLKIHGESGNSYGNWFRHFFDTCNTEFIKIVLRNAESSEREKFISSYRGLELCIILMEEKKWYLLKLFIAECTLSEEAKTRLKDIFMESFWQQKCKKRQNWNRLIRLINNVNVEDCNKRHLKDIGVNEQPAKRLKRKRRRKRF